MMPVVFARNLFGFVVRVLEIIGGLEALDGFFHAADAAEIVSVHVVGVRNVGSESFVGFSVDERLVDVADIFVGMDQIVMSSKVIRLKLEDFFIPVNGFVRATVAASI